VFKRVVVTGCLAFISAVLVSGQAGPPQRAAAARPASQAQTPAAAPAQRPAATSQTAAPDISQPRALIDQYCVTCHNQKLKTANLLLDQLDLAHLSDHAELAEKVIRKLRAGMMPPKGMPRPDPDAREKLITWMEDQIDTHATPYLAPPGIHRLNRAEYANVVRDLLDLEVDASKFLPSDDSTHGFDNIAGALRMSPALMEAYLSAAGKISRLAIGSTKAASQAVYVAPEDVSQDYHIEGLPFGTRGGMLIRHEFPADAYYVFQVFPINKGNMGGSGAFGEVTGEQLKVYVDGDMVHQFDWDAELSRGQAVHAGANTEWIWVPAGLHTVGITFSATNYAPGFDLNAKFLRSTIQTGSLPGMTFYPHVGRVRIEGPYDPEGAEDTPSRRKIFTCRPTTAREEESCARQIVTNLARRAFRRPTTPQDVGTLMEFYVAGRNEGGNFEAGIERALRRLLADPEFVYRRETEPVNVAPGKPYRLTDLALASRLSFFLWSSIPDDELLDLATRKKLGDPATLERQVRRMLADERSDAIVSNFAGQWLQLRNVRSVQPNSDEFPDFDDNLRQAFRRETELLFGSLITEDRSVLDLLRADYTFVNERLAKHYGIPGIHGSRFRRVAVTEEARKGLLGQGSVLSVTSHAERTSPVLRGKWVLENLLGLPVPPPPPDVNQNLPTPDGEAPKTLREQMAIHRANPTCATCHKVMDPVGFAMENFDVVGAWRTREPGGPIDASGQLADGRQIDGVVTLRNAILEHPEIFVTTMTEKMMTYALGRGVEASDMPAVRRVVRDAAKQDYRFSSMVMGIVKSVPFQMRAALGDQASGTR
jgi:mono/diheme cytochrome c family protein